MTVRSYGERTAIVSGRTADGDKIVLAGVHTVYAGEHVTPVKPLFAGTMGEQRHGSAAQPPLQSVELDAGAPGAGDFHRWC